MSKFVLIAAICALFTVSAGAQIIIVPPVGFTGVSQNQANVSGITNGVILQHGDTAQNIVALNVTDMQDITDVSHLTVHEGMTIALWQNAVALADCGIINVVQELGSAGSQGQLIGDGVDAKAQGQALTLDGMQGLTKTDGQANSTVFQGGLINQNQVGTNAAGTVSESANIGSYQFSSVAGGPGTTAAVGSTISTQTSQSQVVY